MLLVREASAHHKAIVVSFYPFFSPWKTERCHGATEPDADLHFHSEDIQRLFFSVERRRVVAAGPVLVGCVCVCGEGGIAEGRRVVTMDSEQEWRQQQQQHLIYSSESLKERSGTALRFLEERKSLQCLRRTGYTLAPCEGSDIWSDAAWMWMVCRRHLGHSYLI